MVNKNFKGEIFPEFNKNNAVFINNLLKKIEEIYNVIGNNDLQLVKLKDLYKPTAKGLEANKSFFEYYYNTKASKQRISNTEIEGLYIFFNSDRKPIYTGISRGIIRRLRNHGWGGTSGTSTLAYLMAKDKNTSLTALGFNNNEGEIKEKYLKIVQNLFVYIYPFQGSENIDNEGHEYFSLQVLEVMVSVRLQCYWNSFKTH